MVRARQLLPCPESCPEYVYNLMKACWDEQAVRRPAFAEIGHRLKVWYQQQKRVEQTEQNMSSRKGSALSIASKSERKGSMNFDTTTNLSVRSSINRSTKSVNTVGMEASLSRRNTADIFDGGHVSMYGDGISLHSQQAVPPSSYNHHFSNNHHHHSNDNDSISHSQRSYSRKNQRSHSVNVENRAAVTGSVASIASESQSSRLSVTAQPQGQYLPPTGRPSNSLKKGCHHMKN